MSTLLGNRRGFALESTVVVMVLLTVLIGAAVTSAVMTQRTAGMDYRGSRVSYATEAGADNVMAQLEVAMGDGIVTPAELAALTPPVVPGFTYTAISAVAGPAVPRTITSGPYAGLIGLNQADRHHRRGAGRAGQPCPGHRHRQRPVHPAVPVRCVLRGRPRDS